jgi:hypothetical protein
VSTVKGFWLATTKALVVALEQYERTEDFPVVVYDGSDNWSAAYVSDELVKDGEKYVVDEWLRERFGVLTVNNDDFLLGQNTSAKTLGAVVAYAGDRDKKLSRAAELRAQAEELLARAKTLEESK